MNIATKDRWASLYYRTAESTDRHPDAPHPSDDFYHITAVPTADMGANPEAVAQAFAELTLSPLWYKQGRRMAGIGDVFTYNSEVWQFVDPEAVCDSAVTTLFGLPFLGIVRVQEKEHG